MSAREFTADQLYGPKAGPEIDGRPVAIPAGFRRPPTLMEQVRRLVRTNLSEIAESKGAESWLEYNDFDIPDDPVDPSTPFEEFFDPGIGRAITPDEMNRFDAAYREEFLKAQGDAIAFEDRAAALRDHVQELRRKKNKAPEGSTASSPPTDAPQQS